MRLAVLTTIALFMALLLGACTSEVTGSAVKAEGGPAAGTVDISRLDVGPYPTEPRPPLGVAGDPMLGVVLEAQRMANNVVGPWEVDPALTTWFGLGGTVLKAADALALIGPPQLAAAAGRHGFVNGFASSRAAEDQKILLNAVLRFSDPASASAAAAEMGGIASTIGIGAAKASIPGHPDALATSYTITDGPSGKEWGAVRSFMPHGQYVLMQLAQTADGVGPAIGLVAKTIDLQGPVIDQFRATDPAEFADISIDPTGLLARTLPVPEKEATVVQNTTYEQRGALHFQHDPTRSAGLFTETGMDLVAMAKTNVYQAKDPQGAARIVDGFFAELQPTSRPAKPVENLAESRCLQLEDKTFYCLAAADKYAIEATSENLLDAQQQTAAQYVLLVSG